MIKRYNIISTHTLTWSVTKEYNKNPLPGHYFNSHAHVERDNPVFRISGIQKISTHTLTWSVT